MARELTSEERAVLAHVVVDPDAWWADCVAHFKGDPEQALAAKVARWRPEYEAASARPGYKTRAERGG